MTLPIRYRVLADKDVSARTRRLGRIDAELARRFFMAYYATVDEIANSPGLGSPWPTTRKRINNLRYWPVQGFKHILIFYRESQGELVVMRVLHSRQNISRIFPTNGPS